MHPYLSKNAVYPLLFKLRGESVIDDLGLLREMQWHDENLIIERQVNSFLKVVKEGITKFEFYRRFVKESGLNISDIHSLEDVRRWPIMSKLEVNKAVMELRARKGKLPLHTIRMTGGSSGDPCLVLADRTCTSRSLAARMLFQEWHGVQLGDRQVRLWGRPLLKGIWKEHLKDFLLNRIRFDSLALGQQHIYKTIKKITDFGAEYIYGYASLIALFIENLDDIYIERLNRTLRLAISTSETMSGSQRERLQSKISRSVVDEYGCSEIDIISFSCPDGGRHVSAENVLVEIVQFGDEPEGYGHVVVTDLVNTMMPIIRYDLGDIVPIEEAICSCGRGWPCIGPVLGRIQNQFIFLGDRSIKIHSQFVVYMLENLFNQGWGIGKFQIVQEEIDLLVLYFIPITGKICDLKKIHGVLHRDGRRTFGEAMRWQVVPVDNEFFINKKINKYQHFISNL